MRKIDVNSLENRYFRMHIGTDAYPYKVLAAYVDDDNNLKRCVVQGMLYSADPTKECHEGHQNWVFNDNPDGDIEIIVPKRNRKGEWTIEGGAKEFRFFPSAEPYAKYDWEF